MEGFVTAHKEGDTVIRLTFTGLVDGPDADRSARACRDAFGDRPFAMMVETPQLKGLTPLARKEFADMFHRLNVVACALMRASLPTRAISTFIVAAINIFRRQRRLELAFYEDDDEARAWCEKMVAQTQVK